ncbi:hypothetical protein BDV93DRAFT_544069 [Ceratobasidium sp. AG-I]|nr:hypothetical protein BDV93DRAFT_544069 [Ceratobasidium sp. AG-I]
MQSSKAQFYLDQCVQAAEKSTMSFTLGAVLVKSGKIIARGHNHQRTHYDGSCKQLGRKPISMHAEMHTILAATGMTPSFKLQVQPESRFETVSEQHREPEGGQQQVKDRNQNENKNPEKPGSRFFAELFSPCSHTVLRNTRTNGADIYVARVRLPRSTSQDSATSDSDPESEDTRYATPVGSARPCTRCLMWCHWAGIRRVFYWSTFDAESGDSSGTKASQAGRFVCIKPAEALRNISLGGNGEEYVTQADLRIVSGTFQFL